MQEDKKDPKQSEDDEAGIIPDLRASNMRRQSHGESSERFETDQGEND